jgi:hypothetical protein
MRDVASPGLKGSLIILCLMHSFSVDMTLSSLHNTVKGKSKEAFIYPQKIK